MREVYATCSSYQDEGTVETVFVRQGKERTVTQDFETAFVRPDRFYFGYSQQDEFEMLSETLVRVSRYVIWSNADGVSTWWTVRPGIRRWTSVQQAVWAARGVSSAASTRTSSLQIPEVRWEALLDVASASILGEETLGGVPCWRIEARSGESRFPVWIDQEQHLLRQVYREKEFDDFSTRTTTTYSPRINVEIPDGKFEFRPPK
jgi:outer membrane lipoprotein-sorting protein